jgi:hypothetical protein
VSRSSWRSCPALAFFSLGLGRESIGDSLTQCRLLLKIQHKEFASNHRGTRVTCLFPGLYSRLAPAPVSRSAPGPVHQLAPRKIHLPAATQRPLHRCQDQVQHPQCKRQVPIGTDRRRLPGSFPPERPATFPARRLHTGRATKPRYSPSPGPGWPMPDQSPQRRSWSCTSIVSKEKSVSGDLSSIRRARRAG